ncbi:MAG TPA: hypothetical protein VIU87_00885 [Mycobacterium sp.]
MAEQALETEQTTGRSVLRPPLRRAAAGSVGRPGSVVCASDLGRRAWAVATTELDRVQGEWVAHLGADVWAVVHRLLTRLREIIDPCA